MNYENSLSFAHQQDQQDPLASFRDEFIFPQIDGKNALYFTGHALGLLPKKTKDSLLLELEDWGNLGSGAYLNARNPWLSYHERFTDSITRLLGALPEEVVVMNSLTTNLHLLMVSFYRPTPTRYKILCEERVFSSDQYMLESQAKFHGFDPEKAIVEVKPRSGEHTIRLEDILATIDEIGDELALIMIGSINYYTGQAFEMEKITAAGHKVGALVGFDLAHSIGNIMHHLHDWDVDFAAWCSYKYLNSGSGGTAGIFVHQRYANDNTLPRFTGWWGHDKKTRFEMQKGFMPIPGAEGWQLSPGPILNMAAHRAALDIFDRAGIDNLCKKRDKLTGYLEYLVDEISEQSTIKITIITPRDKHLRGIQLSLLFEEKGNKIYDYLIKKMYL